VEGAAERECALHVLEAHAPRRPRECKGVEVGVGCARACVVHGLERLAHESVEHEARRGAAAARVLHGGASRRGVERMDDLGGAHAVDRPNGYPAVCNGQKTT
jgi:hypothetical protein